MDLTLLELVILTTCTLLTSSIAGVIGQGGGLILIAILAIYIELPLLILIHGVIQLSSNASRAYFSLPDVIWPIALPIVCGVFLGALLMAPFLNQFNWPWLESLIGLYILQQTWLKTGTIPFKLPFPMISIGLLQGTLGMVVGATGPLANSLLLKQGLLKNQIVASNAVIMSSSHLIKIILYMAVGFSFLDDALEVLLLCVASIIGSKLGTHLRGHIPEKQFLQVFKVVLSLLAARMLFNGLF